MEFNLTPLELFLMPGMALPIVAFVLLDQWNQFKNDLKTIEPPPKMPTSFLPALHFDIEDEIEQLERRLPTDSWIDHRLTNHGASWRFEFKCNSADRRFFAAGTGKSPKEAFLIAKHHLVLQIGEWHRTRFETPLLSPAAEQRPVAPKVLIIDDDVDLALAMQVALGQLGCETTVETRPEGLHRKLIDSDADFIFMDWKLGDKVTAGDVMERASRLISTFSDLRRKFADHKQQVITYSVLDRAHVAVPESGREFFNHTDHWQKPMPFTEVISRASSLLNAHA